MTARIKGTPKKKSSAKAKKVSALEKEVLEIVLKELRRAMRRKTQVCMTIDPWLRGGGTHIFVSLNETGTSYEVGP